MPNPHTGTSGADPGDSLWTFDAAGNLVLAGRLYENGAAPSPGAPVAPSLSPAGQSLGGALSLAASTGPAGFALTAATPNVLTWTPPADGGLHRVLVIMDYIVTEAATGGQVDLGFTDPTGQFQNRELVAGGQPAGFAGPFAPGYYLVAGGQEVYLAQTSALTAGAVTVYAELWAS